MPAHSAPMPIDAAHRLCLVLAAALCLAVAGTCWGFGNRMRVPSGRVLLVAAELVIIVVVPAFLVLQAKLDLFLPMVLTVMLMMWRIRSSLRRYPLRSDALGLGLKLGAFVPLVTGIRALFELNRIPELRSVSAWIHLLPVISACASAAVWLAAVLAVWVRKDRSFAGVALVGLVMFGFSLSSSAIAHHTRLVPLTDAICGALALAYVRYVLSTEDNAPPPLPEHA